MAVAAQTCLVARRCGEAARRGVDLQVEAGAVVRLPVGVARGGLAGAEVGRLHSGGQAAQSGYALLFGAWIHRTCM